MRSNPVRVLVGIAVVVVAVVLLLLLKDDGSDSSDSGSKQSSAPAAVPTIVVKGGKPVGGILSLSYKKGDQIRFKVESDASDEVHVHGYDIEEEVEAGGSVNFDFPATIEGGFEVEMHHGGQIVELTVNP